MIAPQGKELPQDRAQALAYISDMTQELALVARRNGFDALGYLLDMARLEAESAACHPETPEAKVAHG